MFLKRREAKYNLIYVFCYYFVQSNVLPIPDCSMFLKRREAKYNLIYVFCYYFVQSNVLPIPDFVDRRYSQQRKRCSVRRLQIGRTGQQLVSLDQWPMAISYGHIVTSLPPDRSNWTAAGVP